MCPFHLFFVVAVRQGKSSYYLSSTCHNIKSNLIPFQRVIVDSGKAMDWASEVFNARRMGTYFLSFTGLANFPTPSSLVYFNFI